MKHLLDVLKPHSIENGGPLKVEHVHCKHVSFVMFVEGRGNLMITYTPEGASTVVSKVLTIGSYIKLRILAQLGAPSTRIQLCIWTVQSNFIQNLVTATCIIFKSLPTVSIPGP